jgi:hypothetical protein
MTHDRDRSIRQSSQTNPQQRTAQWRSLHRPGRRGYSRRQPFANAAIAASRVSAYPRAALARRTFRPGISRPIRRPWKRIRSAKATAPRHLGQTLLLRGIAAVLADATPCSSIGRTPACAGPRRLAPLRARPALGVSVGEQQSHYCDTEQTKTDRAHGSSPSPSFRAANAKGEAASPPSQPMNSRRCISMSPSSRTMQSIAGRSRASQQKRPAHVRLGSKPVVLRSSTRFPLRPQTRYLRVNAYTREQLCAACRLTAPRRTRQSRVRDRRSGRRRPQVRCGAAPSARPAPISSPCGCRCSRMEWPSFRIRPTTGRCRTG